MLKKKCCRVLCLALALLLAASLFPVTARAAAGVVEVSDMETFKTLMTQNGDVEIRLTGHLFEQHGWVSAEGGDLPMWAKVLFPWFMAIEHARPRYYDPSGEVAGGPSGQGKDDYDYKMPYWMTVGSGTKTVDLNGYSIVVDYPNIFEKKSTMFRINAGTSLTINDSTGTGGYIHYEGYIFDVEEYNDEIYYFATEMSRHLFEVNGGSLTVNGGTLEAGRAKQQWITNAHPVEVNGVNTHWVNQHKSYTGNVTKSVTGRAFTVRSGSLRINGGVFLGRGEGYAVVDASGGSVRIVEGKIDARGGADCLWISGDAVDLEILSGAFMIHKNDIVYEGRSTGIEGYPYVYHYGRGGSLGFGKEDLKNYDRLSVSFMDPNPPRHWMVPNSIVQGDGFDLWNALVSPGQETFMIVRPVSHEADIEFMADPTKFHLTLRRDQLILRTRYTPVFIEASAASGTPDYAVCFYDVYDADTMEVLGHCYADPQAQTDLCALLPDLADRLVDGRTYFVFSTVVETYQGAYPYEVRSVCCSLINITSSEPITITQQPTAQMAPGKGGEVTLTATAKNATEAYWEMTQPYYQRLEATTFRNGTATLTVPVTEGAAYRCQFTNPAYWSEVTETYTYLPTNAADVMYMPAFELKPGDSRDQAAVAGYDANIVLYHDAPEDTGQPFYGQDYGYHALFTWYKDGVPLDMNAKNPDSTDHYVKSAYWGGGLGLRITEVTAADAGRYECRCWLDETPFRSGQVKLQVMASAGEIYDVDLWGMGPLYIGNQAPSKAAIRSRDIRAEVKDLTWANLDSAGRLTADSYYTITLEAKYGAVFDQELWWSMDEDGFDYAIVSDDGITATLEYRGKYQPEYLPREEDDTVVLYQTAFTLYQGSYYPLNMQLKLKELVCPKAHSTVLGHRHTLGSVVVAEGSDVPLGLSIGSNAFCGEVRADPGIYKVTLRYTFIDADTGVKHNDCDVVVTFTVLPAQGDTVEIEHYHDFGEWTSDGADTHSAVCADCGESVTFLHDWDDGVVTKFPTKNSEGAMTFTCQICGETYTEPVAYGDYLPPFPEVSALTYEGSLVTVHLSEFSGYASNVLLSVAAYGADGRLLRSATGRPAKTGVFAAELVAGAKYIRVFILDDASFAPLTAPYVQAFG
jgi:hypothetical protein